MHTYPPDEASYKMSAAGCAAIAIHAAAREAGSMTALAKLLGLDRKTVYNWARARKIPVEPTNYVLEIERLTKLPRWFIRPDIYDWPEGAAAVTSIGVYQLSKDQNQ